MIRETQDVIRLRFEYGLLDVDDLIILKRYLDDLIKGVA